MTDNTLRDRIRDELAGWLVGSIYHSAFVSVADARDMAEAVLAVLADPPDDVIEQAARALDRNFNPDSYLVRAAMFRDYAVTAFRAVFGGERA